MADSSSIWVGQAGEVVWVKVEGKGSFLNSGGLKEFALKMLDREKRNFVIDLFRCPVMDSTFMGTLAGIALRLREAGGGSMQVINANERNSDLLSGLGLDQLFELSPSVPAPAPQTPVVELPVEGEGKTERTRTMLEAHEALVEADPENLTKFRDVLDFLKQDLDRDTK